MIYTGRVCIKIAGRDAGKKCVVTKVVDKNYVLVDGETRARKCNIIHLEPTLETLEISEEASHEEVEKAFKKLNVEVRNTKPKSREKYVPVPKNVKKETTSKPKKDTEKSAKAEKTLDKKVNAVEQEETPKEE